MRLSHRQAVLAMVGVTLLWSIAGVVTRQLEAARSFEVTFWRSLFNALALAIALTVMRGLSMWPRLLRAPVAAWISGLCWAVMFTAFMVALTLTTVANVLITMAIGPLVTALFARLALGHRLPARTWFAIAVAGLGIAWMFGHEAGASSGQGWLGTLVAAGVPLAAALNWTVLQRTQLGGDAAADMLPAVLIGAVLSALITVPLSLPFQASAHDIGWLAMLGFVQLAVPCLLVVSLTRVLPGPEIALIGLLEVVFGVAWAWLGADEAPSPSTFGGGALVLGALVVNEAIGLGTRQDAGPTGVPPLA